MSKKEGKGKYSWGDGSTFDGDWLDNKICGIGVYLWNDGRKYEGEYIDDKKEG